MYKISVIVCFVLLITLKVLSKSISSYTKQNMDIIKSKATEMNETKKEDKNTKTFKIKGPITYILPFIPIANVLFSLLLIVFIGSEFLLLIGMKNVVNN